MVAVDAAGEPSAARRGPPGGGVDGLHDDGAHEVAQRKGAPEERGRHGLERRRRLWVEELHEADVGEHVGDAEHGELRRQPEAGHGQMLDPNNHVQHAVPRGHLLALRLHDGGDDHGDDGEHEADADALQVRDPGGDARQAARQGHEELLVDGDGEDEEAERDDEHGSHRHLEMRPERRVHRAALHHGEGLQLREAGAHDDGAAEDGHHGQHRLGLLHLCHPALTPRVRRRILVCLNYGRPVQESASWASTQSNSTVSAFLCLPGVVSWGWPVL